MKKLSHLLKWSFYAAALSLPILNAGFWITDGYPFLEPIFRWNILPDISVMKPLSELSAMTKLFGFLISLIPTSINVIALAFLGRFFKSFETGEIFSNPSVRYLKKIGLCVIANQFFYPFYEALISVTLTISNPPGQRMLCVGFGIHQLQLLVIGSSILLLSYVIDRGRKMQEEIAGTV